MHEVVFYYPPDTMAIAATPRHERVSSWIRDQIESGSLLENDKLPSENQLGQRFGVSRITIRRALQTLENEGLISRRQGLGSFVADQRLHQGLDHLSDFVEDMHAAGLEAESIVLEEGPEKAGARVARALGLEEGTSVYRIDRLRKGNGETLAYDRTWIPMFYAHLLQDQDLEATTIYRVLEEKHGICVCKGTFRIEAINAPNDVAQHLDVPWGRALLLMERTTFSEAEKQVYFQQRFYRSDKVAYEVELHRSKRPKATVDQPVRGLEPVFKN
jgi:GntR family transcriptional regulator